MQGGILADKKNVRLNDQIRAKEVRLIDENGEQKGVVATTDALQMAFAAGLDLVEIAPNSEPPVCKIMDYGKFKFDQERKLKDNRKNQKVIKLKEVQLHVKTDENALSFKSKHIVGFLEEGNKVKLSIRFKGREMAHPELGMEVFKKMLEKIEGSYVIEKDAVYEGRSVTMIIAPKAAGGKKTTRSKEDPVAEDTNQ